ncbi:MAG: endonuclease MutS2 [Candidatus Cloacimonetes bacterium]|nr:endonuclease MutS2 [Candidatus Cloacimonadota bacterium]
MTDLEFAILQEQIRRRCQSDLGKVKCDEIRILPSVEEMHASQALIAEIQSVLEGGLEFTFEDLADLEPYLEEKEYHVFTWEEFFLFAQNAYLACRIKEREVAFDDLPRAKKIVKRLTAIPEIMQGFQRIFDLEGEVKDDASPELKKIRRGLYSLRGRIQKTMQSLLNEPRMESHLQDKFVTQRDDRYVLPIRESSAPAVKGIILSRSQSKSTVFIEPAEVVPLNNELQLLKEDEKREVHRILSEFSLFIRGKKRELLLNMKVMADLDFLYGVARLCNLIRANVPKMSHQAKLHLISARHPLLILRKHAESGERGYHEVIPFDLKLGGDYNLMLLSGPNTGGKTVLMKAVGLITLMAMSGLPVPADEESTIGCFTGIYADIGDDQSIENALSTFSSHLDKIGKMLQKADENSLILIDEIGAATDPQQGSALAQAILERLAELGAKGIVTTHYTALKVFAETNDSCVNASMQFDMKSLVPTYRFSVGIPGDSYAIEVAASLGMDEAMITRAKELSGSQNLEFGQLIKTLQEQRKELGKQIYQYELSGRNLQVRVQELEAKEEEWEKELKARRQKHLRDLQNELISFQKLYNKEISGIRELEKAERKRVSERKLHDINVQAEKLQKEMDSLDAQDRSRLTNPQPGDRTWVAGFGAEGVITAISAKNATVDINGFSVQTARENLFQSEQKAKTEVPVVSGISEVKVRPATELMLLGLTFDEAMPLIDEFLDNAALSGFSRLRIVHGKGTGVLRKKVRDYLRRKSIVKSIDTPPPFEGGNGVSIVTI